MSSDLKIIDGIIMIGDTWDFDKKIYSDTELPTEDKKGESTTTSVLEKEKKLEITTIKKRCGGGFYYK